MRAALPVVGLTAASVRELYEVVAATLLLGQLTFTLQAAGVHYAGNARWKDANENLSRAAEIAPRECFFGPACLSGLSLPFWVTVVHDGSTAIPTA